MLDRLHDTVAPSTKRAYPPLSRSTVDAAPSSSLLTRTAISQIPALIAIFFGEIVSRYSDSGYSVVVIVLLGAMLYTALRAGWAQGVLSAIIIVLYNFVVVAHFNGYGLFTLENLQSGAVIALAFPVLATIVGRLKERNDILLKREKLARFKAEESARQLQFMAESMPQKIFTVLPNGDIDYINPQWAEYLSSPTMQGKAEEWPTIVHPDDLEENTQLWEQSLASGKPFQFEHRLKHRDGTYRWHLTRANALRDENDKISLWIGSSTDIEDVKKTKKLEADTARLIKQRAQLMELNNVKDEFISLASHQLRTPATGVKQFINMAIDGLAGPITPELKVLLKKADESNERQLAIINDLLQVAQIDAGKVSLRKEQIDVTELLKNVIQEQSAKLRKRKQTARFDSQKRRIMVMADPTKLRMVLENLIDNASKYSPENTTITVRAISSRGKVRISVIDQGVGIRKSDINKIFQKFARLDNRFSTIVGGTGLGLYWGQKIIDLHGGDITVTSEVGKGTTFVVSLPTHVNSDTGRAR